MLGHDYESVVERVSFIAREYHYYKMLASFGLPSLGLSFIGLGLGQVANLGHLTGIVMEEVIVIRAGISCLRTRPQTSGLSRPLLSPRLSSTVPDIKRAGLAHLQVPSQDPYWLQLKLEINIYTVLNSAWIG